MPTPAVEESEPTPAPEPIPTEKPYSEYNEMLKNTNVIYVNMPQVDSFGKHSLSALESASNLIVLATVTKKEQIEFQEDWGGTTMMTSAKLKIEKVFKGDIAAGDELEITELTSVSNEGNSGNMLAPISGLYFPSWEHRSYLFFLEKIEQAPAEYAPVDRWYGKYPVSPAAKKAYDTGELTCEALELADPKEAGDIPAVIASIFRQVCEKYYPDETVKEIIEREAEYQKYYGE